jgi:uncharacterized protein (TIGR02996 family)
MTHDAFLQAIIDTPDDDTPRLVYADWLDEHGEPERAEFIRVQVGLARLPEDDPLRQGLAAREEKLLAGNRAGWLGPLLWLPLRATFRRGFAEEIELGAATLLARGETLFRSAPVRGVRLRRGEDWLADLLRSPYLGRLSLLDLYPNAVGDPGVAALAGCTALSGLGQLLLRGCRVGPAGARALASSPTFANLTELDLAHNALGDDGVRALAASPHLGRLARLSLAHTDVGDAGVAALAASANLRRLERLDLRGNAVGRAGAAALAGMTC